MTSDIIRVNANGKGIREALEQVEALTAFRGLPAKERLHIRLLAEELMGLLRGLTGEVEAEFRVEDKNGEFVLSLFTHTLMNNEKRKKLIESSTSGKNSAASGIIGKLRDIIETVTEPVDDCNLVIDTLGWMDGDVDYISGCATWSLLQYKQNVEQKKLAEEWDELERSIVANIADEVKVFIKGDTVEMLIYKKTKGGTNNADK
ncbi:MAG: hypothetical protein IJM18_02270 [Clostridia bacterium]|nr:hypothetical protein [Clostridia bacterium]